MDISHSSLPALLIIGITALRQEAFRADNHFSNASKLSALKLLYHCKNHLRKMTLPHRGRRRFTPTTIFPMLQSYPL